MSQQPLGRTFSFDYHDDNQPSRGAGGQNRPGNDNENQYASPYRDEISPVRQQQQQQQSIPPPSYNPPSQFGPSVPAAPPVRFNPSAHPSSAFGEIQAQRRLSRKPVGAGQPAPELSEAAPPPPPPHSVPRAGPPLLTSTEGGQAWGQGLGYSHSQRTASTPTPGMDNFGESAAGGGIAGVALGVANSNERESGVQALRGIEDVRHPVRQNDFSGDTYHGPGERSMSDAPYGSTRPRSTLYQQSSNSSNIPLGAAAVPPGQSTPGLYPEENSVSVGSHPSQDRFMLESGTHFTDNPYNRYSTAWDPRVSRTDLGGINPHDIADDGDDYLAPANPQRRSVLNIGRGPGNAGAAGAGVATGAAAGGIMGTLGSLVGRKASTAQPTAVNQQYGPVPGDGSGDNIEKSEWLDKQTTGRKKLKWIVGILVVLLVIGGIAGGVAGGIIGARKANQASPSMGNHGQTAAQDDGKGDLNKNSAEIQKLMNNPNLFKVFPGIDYTPINTQYPDCLTNPPSQNNVTRDVAVLSQLTNQIRLYGTDCNQTEMTLHAISQLGLTKTKVWLGVWIGNNDTTNTRQLTAMYDILDKNGAAPFVGIIIGNEVLYRKDKTDAEMSLILSGVKSNLTAKKITLPVATSDLGDNWTTALASEVDIVMANIHPFFAGVSADVAASWTWNFFQQHDVSLIQGLTNAPKAIISETGWPSDGGTDCGGGTCTGGTSGSVAGIDQMNKFMDTFICQSLANSTEFFWFEAFDEPWKVQFDTPGKNWEDKWGLMDVNRNLKPGVKIPNCGGKTVA
ncbi:MAG: hypothetical protein M1824_001583 [Vezdaea acicularis]|nr:MAG: hypothetical protein M1824_001583 [Vezdaea acicularis]